jgi:hypothetical protein
MRRFLLCWLALTAAVVAVLSLPSTRANMVQMPFTAGGGAATGTCTASTNFFNRAYTANGSVDLDATHHNAYDRMICGSGAGPSGGLVGDGVWAKLDVLQIYGLAPSSAVGVLNLVSASFTSTLHPGSGSPVFTSNAGFTGIDNSTTVYLDTGFNPVAAAGQFALGSGHHMIWSLTNFQSAVANAGNTDGQYNGTQLTQLNPWPSSGTLIATVNDTNVYSLSSTSSLGSFLINRTAAAVNSEILYLAGVGQSVGGGGAASALINFNFFVLAMNSSGAAIQGAGLQIAAFSVGAGLTPAQISSLGTTTVTTANAGTATGLIPRVCTALFAVHGALTC